ncbi:hypothetical protein AVEN_250933-1 [Araneus ventricosus]|uniref:Uncharacterized protein n=1 Tax=Araneus ventricosus TaxID=182803 RepID=A0A4Y2M8W4_ARAVE|nr:hypothetical protein AVEN_250933-1 [Araneus ventricosus]
MNVLSQKEVSLRSYKFKNGRADLKDDPEKKRGRPRTSHTDDTCSKVERLIKDDPEKKRGRPRTLHTDDTCSKVGRLIKDDTEKKRGRTRTSHTQWRTGQVASLPSGKWAPLNIS